MLNIIVVEFIINIFVKSIVLFGLMLKCLLRNMYSMLILLREELWWNKKISLMLMIMLFIIVVISGCGSVNEKLVVNKFDIIDIRLMLMKFFMVNCRLICVRVIK